MNPAANSHDFVGWEEHIISQQKGNRVVHYYLKDTSGESILAVVGTERSIRHMIYVVSDDFLKAHGSFRSINACTKWRARREVIEWLKSLVSEQQQQPGPFDSSKSKTNDLTQALGGHGNSSMGPPPDYLVQRKLKVQPSDIVWSGLDWVCGKQLKHYPAFCRNETTIRMHSFVLIMAEEEGHYLGYIEDLYEDKKGLKKVKVRWFHHNQEIEGLISDLNPQLREVFITPHVQVISAECIDGPAIILTPKHFEKCLAIMPQSVSSKVHLCCRQFKNNKIKPFSLSKLRGYFNQPILSSIDSSLMPKHKTKSHKHDEKEALKQMIIKDKAPTSQKLKFKLPTQEPTGKFVEPQPHVGSVPFKANDRIELLSWDSGIRGCWFRAKIIKSTQKIMLVQYDDLEDPEKPTKLKECVPLHRVAMPDKLGMRCPDRLAARPRPPKTNLSACTFTVGMAVDAWWCDGWWEGVVTASTADGGTFSIYFPGEPRFLTIEKRDLRISRDWVDNRWVDIKPKPDILNYISTAGAGPIKKRSVPPTVGKASEPSGSAKPVGKVISPTKLEAIKQDKGKSPTVGKASEPGGFAKPGGKVISPTEVEVIKEDKGKLPICDTLSDVFERHNKLEAIKVDKGKSVICGDFSDECMRINKFEAFKEYKGKSVICDDLSDECMQIKKFEAFKEDEGKLPICDDLLFELKKVNNLEAIKENEGKSPICGHLSDEFKRINLRKRPREKDEVPLDI